MARYGVSSTTQRIICVKCGKISAKVCIYKANSMCNKCFNEETGYQFNPEDGPIIFDKET